MRTALDRLRTAGAAPDRQGPLRVPVPGGVEKGTGTGPVAVRRGVGGCGVDGRSRRGGPRQALSPRRATQDAVHAQVTAWAEARNATQKGSSAPPTPACASNICTL